MSFAIPSKVKTFLAGLCIGVADLIPGISGGTVAIILGLYPSIIAALKSFDLLFLKRLYHGKWREAFQAIPWSFLLTLSAGIVLAIGSCVHLIDYLLSQPAYRQLLDATFLGFVVGSAFLMMKRIDHWRGWYLPLMVVIGCLAFTLSERGPSHSDYQVEISKLWVFICGILSICATLLPGISGSYCLNILGMYAPVIAAIAALTGGLSHGELPLDALTLLATLAGGLLVGALAFSRLLSWALCHHHDVTMVTMIGIMLGALRSIWPFYSPLFVMDPLGAATSWLALLSALLAFAAICLIDCYRQQPSKTSELQNLDDIKGW